MGFLAVCARAYVYGVECIWGWNECVSVCACVRARTHGVSVVGAVVG